MATRPSVSDHNLAVLRIVDHLRKTRALMTPSDVRQFLEGRDVPIERFRMNEHIMVTKEGNLIYKPKLQLRNSDDIRNYCKNNIVGVTYKDVVDAYREAKDDLDELIDHGLLIKIETDKNNAVVMPPYAGIDGTSVDDDLKELWASIPAPASRAELEQAIRQMGHVSFDRRDTALVQQSNAGVAGVGIKRKARNSTGPSAVRLPPSTRLRTT